MKTITMLSTLLLMLASYAESEIDFSKKYFKSKQRIKKLQEKRPTQLNCTLYATSRLKKSYAISDVIVELDYLKKPVFDIHQPISDWGNWSVLTFFNLRKNSKRDVKIEFEAIRKDTTNQKEDEKIVENGILLNEKVKLTYRTSFESIDHFLRAGSGLEEMTDWGLSKVRTDHGILESVTATLDIESMEKSDLKGKTKNQTIYHAFSWVNNKNQFKSFLDEVNDDYMFMIKKPSGKFVEVYGVSFGCDFDAENIKI